ncbi:uncharacterized protein LOC105213754 isoform X2 [Zeugodacus cucurbitae]|uniref:uncharacterized protein LOC105213754 isoform X1 n=1 Tax=Zeugodacus cucurbitae TaxID=28588 RepID=UPI0005967EF3|nr:uncharacterized protein LOC105213754 isoform X1 [Zeugodacus cucurbitae]XP_011185106.1 uncharacterized protein LOC105213754 isoform X2 [Zeugodacus cucurbitae]
MAKFVYATVILLLLGVVMIQANACMIQIRLTKPGRRICELKCRPPGQMPVTECYTPRTVYRAVVCPSHCCRLEGTRCRER